MKKNKRGDDSAGSTSGNRGGGKRQRIARAQLANPVTECILQSCLAVELFLKFAWGVYTPQTVQELASCACKDIDQLLSSVALTQYASHIADKFDLGDLRLLSKIGNAGKQIQNCHRDIMKIVSDRPALPRPVSIPVPLKGYTGLQSTYMMLPHEFVASLYTDYYNAFKKILCPSSEKCAEFWMHAKNHPCMKNHPIKEVDGWESFCIPLSLHGDGTPVTGRGKSWCKSLTIFSMASILVGGSTKLSQIYVYSLFDSLMKTGAVGTVEKAMDLIGWSFYHLYLGTWPTSPYGSDVKNHS